MNFAKLLNKHRILVLGCLFILNMVLFYLPFVPGSIPMVSKKVPVETIPDVMAIYSADEVYHFLTAIGEEGRNAYQLMHLTIDFTFPLIYGFLFYSIITSQIQRLGSKHKRLPLIPFLGTGFDLLENGTHLYINGTFPAYQLRATAIAELFSLLKFSFLAVSLIIIVISGVRIIISRLSKSESNENGLEKEDK